MDLFTLFVALIVSALFLVTFTMALLHKNWILAILILVATAPYTYALTYYGWFL